MNLTIDWGNSSLKVGWFDADRLTAVERYPTPDALWTTLAARTPLGNQGPAPMRVIACSTSRPAEAIRAGLTGLGNAVWVLDAQTPVPIQKDYETPHTLGADRVAGAVGAVTLFPDQACLVLDLGTCLTADLVDPGATFRGGLIAPGLRMRLRAMHEQTARLPLIDWPGPGAPDPGQAPETGLAWPELTARSTRQAMLSGVLNGLAFELNGIIETYRRRWPGLAVVLCGGDAPTFESRLKPPIFVVPELVLIGLNRIVNDNVKNLPADTSDTHP